MRRDPIEVLYIGFVVGQGGDALQMLDLAAGMTARGRKVRVIVPAADTTANLAARGIGRGVDIERSKRIRADIQGVRQSIPKLIRLLISNPAQLVHFHTGDVCLPRSVSLVMRMLRRPKAIATLHSPHSTMLSSDSRAVFWARIVSARFYAAICPSEHGRLKQIALGVDPDRVVTIRNGVEVARFSTGDPDRAYATLGLSRDVPLVVFSSRLDSQKRPLDALAAFARVAPELPSVHLVFVGAGAQEGDVREAANSAGLAHRVHLVGYQDNVPDWLAASTAWLLPTEHENYSLAVLEAQAAGCAMVSTDCVGNLEMLSNDVDSLLTPVGDIDAQSVALRRMLTEPDLRLRLSAAARVRSKEHDISTMIDRYERSYVAAGLSRRI